MTSAAPPTTPSGAGATPPAPAQPPSVSTSWATQLSGSTLQGNPTPPSVQSPSTPPAAHNASSPAIPPSLQSPPTWYSSLASSITSSFSSAPSFSNLGVSFYTDRTASEKAWIIRFTKLGTWFITVHLVLATIGLLNLVTTIYSWTNDSGSKSLHDILKKVTHMEGMEQRMYKWINFTATTSHAHEEDEQRRWDALLQVFEDCAHSPRANGTSRDCARMLDFFDSNATLPTPDTSHLARRNIQKLDEIIRRDHLNLSPGVSPLERFWYPSQLQYGSVQLSIVWLIILAALILFTVWQKWGGGLRRRFRSKQKIERDNTADGLDTIHQTADDNTLAFATGGDFDPRQDSVAYRRAGHLRADPHSVAARGAVDRLRSLLDTDPSLDVNKVDEQEFGSILAAAARSGDLATVNYVLSRNPNLNITGGRYHNALQAAAHSGNNAVVERLLVAGTNEVSMGLGGYYGSAINAAAEKANSAMLKSLLTHENTLQSVNEQGGTYGYPLIASAAREDHHSMSILLAWGAKVGLANKTETTALHLAAASGNLKILGLLVGEGGAINKVSTSLGTPLHAACQNMHEDAVKMLLTNGADPSIPDDQQRRTPIHVAANVKGGLPNALRSILQKNPGMVDMTDADDNTALHLASIAGNKEVVQVLLEFNANCGIGDKFNAQPLFRAAGCDFPDIVELLLRVGKADPNAKDVFGRTALHGPAQTTDVRVQRYLIEWGADVNVVGSDRKTPLHEACNMGRIENVKLLLNHPDIKVNELDNDQFPPLYKALCSSDADKKYFNKCVDPAIVILLLERDDIDVNASASIAVQEAARKGFLSILEIMISKHNANLQVQGGKYGSVLQAAAASGNLDLVNLLLQPGHQTNINITGGEFGCALAAAAAFGHVEVVRRLLEAGASPNITGVGRYGSPVQSVCREVDTRVWVERREPIRSLLREYEGRDSEKTEMPYEKHRWNLLPAGWSWSPPGEM